MALPLISKILKEASEISSRKEKVKFLKSHHPNKVMLQLFKYAFDPSIVWALPDGNPPYREFEEAEENDNGLYNEARRLYLFIEGGNENLHPIRRETLFIQLLESIHPEEAKLLLAVKNKNIPYKGITSKLIEEAFPGLL